LKNSSRTIADNAEKKKNNVSKKDGKIVWKNGGTPSRTLHMREL